MVEPENHIDAYSLWHSPIPWDTNIRLSLYISMQWKDTYHIRMSIKGFDSSQKSVITLAIIRDFKGSRLWSTHFRLFLRAIKTWEWFLTLACKTESGPWEISYSSNCLNFSSSYFHLTLLIAKLGVYQTVTSSDLGVLVYWLRGERVQLSERVNGLM